MKKHITLVQSKLILVIVMFTKYANILLILVKDRQKQICKQTPLKRPLKGFLLEKDDDF